MKALKLKYIRKSLLLFAEKSVDGSRFIFCPESQKIRDQDSLEQ